MKSTLETLSPTRVKLMVEVPFSEIEDQLAAAYRRISSQVSIPGFRKGKVPSRVIDQRFGRGTVLEEAVNEALPGFYEAAVAEHSVKALGRPDVEVTDLVDGEKVGFRVEVDVLPEFEVPAYAGVEVQVDDAVVGEDEIDKQLDALRRRFATVKPVERAAADGDLVELDVAGSIGGEVADDYAISSYSHELGSDGLIEGLDAAIVGLAAGERTEFTFTPEAGPHSGHEVTLSVTVKGVRERELPPADDDFAQLASEFDTLDELVADLGERLARMRLMQQGFAAREKAMEALLEAVDIPVPTSLVAEQVEQHFSAEHGEGHAHDHEVDDMDAHRAEVEQDVTKAIRTQFVLDKIAEAEGLSVGQDELSQWLVTQAPRYNMSPDDFAKALVQAGQVQSAVAEVRRAKAVDLVVAQAVITDRSGNPVDLSVLEPPSAEAANENPTAAEAESQAGPEVARELADAAAVVDDAERRAASELP